MQLYFIRHAQSTNNHLWDQTQSSIGRSVDPELTDVGWEQARAVAQFVSREQKRAVSFAQALQNVDGFHFTHIYSSLMVRAVMTGSEIARAANLRLVALEHLHEAGGIYEEDELTGERIGRGGQTRQYFAQNFPECDLPDSVTDDGWWNRPWEEPELRLPRAQSVWADLLARHGSGEDRVAIISHGAFYNYFMAAIWQLPGPESTGRWFDMNNCGITRIDVIGERVGLRYTNRVDFLPPDLIT